MHPAPHECGKGKSGEAVNLVSSETWRNSSLHQLCIPARLILKRELPVRNGGVGWLRHGRSGQVAHGKAAQAGLSSRLPSGCRVTWHPACFGCRRLRVQIAPARRRRAFACGYGGCSSDGRALGCDPGCRGFDPRHSPDVPVACAGGGDTLHSMCRGSRTSSQRCRHGEPSPWHKAGCSASCEGHLAMGKFGNPPASGVGDCAFKSR